MTKIALLLLTVCLITPAALADSLTLGESAMVKPAARDKGTIAGTWQGSLDVGHGMKLPLVFNFKQAESGKWEGDMLSPSQAKKPIPVDQVTVAGSLITVKAAALKLVFTGELGDDAIDGMFNQAGVDLALKLRRTGAYEAPRKKQDPVKPYPYTEKEVSFKNGEITLAGTLTYPKEASAPLPAVILICGSGPHDRNEEIFYHKPFLIIADYLTRQGFAVLRYDKRGNGDSTGKYGDATSLDFAADAEAAFNFLKTQGAASGTNIDPHKIGLLGHSEGGLIAPVVASKNADVAFIVSLAGSAVTGEQILLSQTALLARAAGESDDKVKSDVARAAKAYEIVKTESDNAKAIAQLKSLAGPDASKKEQDELGAALMTITKPWYRMFITLDPGQYWRQVHCPVLALNGDKDLQVDAAINLPAIKKDLDEAGNTKLTEQLIPGVNHLFQHCATGSIKEYAEIEETFSPDVLKIIGDWMVATTHKAN